MNDLPVRMVHCETALLHLLLFPYEVVAMDEVEVACWSSLVRCLSCSSRVFLKPCRSHQWHCLDSMWYKSCYCRSTYANRRLTHRNNCYHCFFAFECRSVSLASLHFHRFGSSVVWCLLDSCSLYSEHFECHWCCSDCFRDCSGQSEALKVECCYWEWLLHHRHRGRRLRRCGALIRCQDLYHCADGRVVWALRDLHWSVTFCLLGKGTASNST